MLWPQPVYIMGKLGKIRMLCLVVTFGCCLASDSAIPVLQCLS